MVALVEAAWLSKAIYVAASLNLADLLRDGPKRSAELAALSGANRDALARIMTALTAAGLFAADEEGRFSVTELGATLRTDVPGSLNAWALLMLGDPNQEAWSDVLHTVRTGESAFTHRHGMDLWQYHAAHPEYATLFATAMASFTTTYVENVLRSYPFATFRTIVDVGGGDGSLLLRILGENAETRGTVFDLPQIAARAKQRIDDAQLSGRCVAIGGDALVDVPAGGDAYILSRVLHDWDDERAVTILASCRRALGPDGRVLVIERAMPDQPGEIASRRGPVLSDITLTDLNMLVMTSGRERCIAEYQALFRAARLALVRVVHTETAMNVMEARAA